MKNDTSAQDAATFLVSLEMRVADPAPNNDATRRVRDLVALALEYDREKAALEDRLEHINAARINIRHKELPLAMDTAGLLDTTFPAEKGVPEARVCLKPYFKANIAADWDESRRRAAFDHLAELGAQDLIKTEVTVYFPREQRKAAVDFAAEIRDRYGDIRVQISENVPWMTLTSWLKERVKKNVVTAKTLELIGGIIGRIVDIRIR